jgi:hypothetical protein
MTGPHFSGHFAYLGKGYATFGISCIRLSLLSASGISKRIVSYIVSNVTKCYHTYLPMRMSTAPAMHILQYDDYLLIWISNGYHMVPDAAMHSHSFTRTCCGVQEWCCYHS